MPTKKVKPRDMVAPVRKQTVPSPPIDYAPPIEKSKPLTLKERLIAWLQRH